MVHFLFRSSRLFSRLATQCKCALKSESIFRTTTNTTCLSFVYLYGFANSQSVEIHAYFTFLSRLCFFERDVRWHTLSNLHFLGYYSDRYIYVTHWQLILWSYGVQEEILRCCSPLMRSQSGGVFSTNHIAILVGDITRNQNIMDMTSSAMWFTVSVVFITVLIGIIRGRTAANPIGGKPLPPVVNGFALLRLLPRLFRKDLPTKINYLYNKYGSVFTVSLFGRHVTFLVGPEVSAHFYQGLDSEISHGNLLEFTVPMFGQEVAHGVDTATRNEQARFYLDALKQSKLRRHFDPMLQEVEGYFGKWGQEGIVDLKHEFEQLLMLISSRCLLGKEVREKMFDEFYTLFRDIENGVNLVSVFFPYIPTPANRKRDKARAKLTELLSEIVKSRKSSGRVEEDALQKLIDSKYKDGHSTTETEVTGMIIGLIFGGKHTSSYATTWTGACLLTHAKFLVAASEEQDGIMMKYKDKIEYDALLEMNILHSCIKEALRMHPPTPMLVRKVQKHFVVQTKEGQEYDIPKGHTIASPIVQNNKMPYIYKDPQLYDPDRFGPARQEDVVGGKFSYTSFGGGRHVCSGEAYAYLQIKLIWSHLLRNFDLKLLSPYPKTDWNKLIPEPQGNMMVRYKRHRLLD